MYMKYRRHSAGSFDRLIKINVTFRNADQMCVCVVSLIYMCIVCVCCVSNLHVYCVCVCLMCMCVNYLKRHPRICNHGNMA